jgi:y4mF family transcriptional regulator
MKSKIGTNCNPLGDFVRDRRRANNLTQQGLAELAEVGTRLVSELERGKATLRMDAVNKVLKVFGKTLGLVAISKDEDDE